MNLLDCIRHTASRLRQSGVMVAHSEDNPLDEARALVLHALHLPAQWPAHLGEAVLLDHELAEVEALLRRRIEERRPAAYLIGSAPFAGLRLLCDERALVPRSPIAELIVTGFQPWLGSRQVEHALDLCTGGGAIAVAMAVHRPDWQVDAVDLSPEALALAAENCRAQRVEDRVALIESDLFTALGGRSYQLIVSNPPYVSRAECDALAAEYAHEPRLGLESGEDGCDVPLRILEGAVEHLGSDGLLVVEVGETTARRLQALLPRLPFEWIEFEVGPMGVFVLAAATLQRHHGEIADLLAARKAQLPTGAADQGAAGLRTA